MKCKICNGATYVIDSRCKSGDKIKRRRECEQCRERFTTYESEKQDVAAVQYMDDILAKATINGLAEYLLYGTLYDTNHDKPEERIDAVYAKFDRLVEECCDDNNSISRLQDCGSDLVREASEVYMAKGLQAGIMLMTQASIK